MAPAEIADAAAPPDLVIIAGRDPHGASALPHCSHPKELLRGRSRDARQSDCRLGKGIAMVQDLAEAI